jgi:ribosomal protein S18 acetylase RimI-like enzyme
VSDRAVAIRRLRDDEYDAWYEASVRGYARSMIDDGGIDEERANEKAHSDFAQIFTARLDTPGQLVFVVEEGGEPAGWLWLAERHNPMSGRHLFVYEVHVDDARRGRGLGRAAMQFAEEEAKRRGLSKIELNVFGGNDVARGLYRSLGYHETAVYMVKQL